MKQISVLFPRYIIQRTVKLPVSLGQVDLVNLYLSFTAAKYIA